MSLRDREAGSAEAPPGGVDGLPVGGAKTPPGCPDRVPVGNREARARCVSSASADFTSFNTTVNGGATGATLTVTYAENVRVVDYPNTYSPSLG